MSKQLTLGEGFEKYAKTTKRAQFLSDMDRVVLQRNLTRGLHLRMTHRVEPEYGSALGLFPGFHLLWRLC